MEPADRLEIALQHALSDDLIGGTPPRLTEAVRYAVFPGGARVRPRLCLSVAAACGDDEPGLTDATAVAIELLHCASLVHDDLPCFDGSALRRGKPSVHSAFDRALALLAGDALIVHSFHTLALAGARAPHRLPGVLTVIGMGVGMPSGIVAGQAWECEPETPMKVYHRAKTGSLFAAATMGGAAAAGSDPEPWRKLGESLGEAYQVADDLLDVNGDPEITGKPAGQDASHDRPNAVSELGLQQSARMLRGLVAEAIDSVPDCPGKAALRVQIAEESEQFVSFALRCRDAA